MSESITTIWIIGQFELIEYNDKYGLEYILVNLALPVYHPLYVCVVGRL